MLRFFSFSLNDKGTIGPTHPILLPLRVRLLRSVFPWQLRRKTEGVIMDQSQQPETSSVDDLLALSQEMTALGPGRLFPALLEEMASVALLHAVGIVDTVRVPLVVLDITLHVLMTNPPLLESFPVTPPGDGVALALQLGGTAPSEHSRPAAPAEECCPHHTTVDDFEATPTFPDSLLARLYPFTEICVTIDRQ